jgi:hypothetical protein
MSWQEKSEFVVRESRRKACVLGPPGDSIVANFHFMMLAMITACMQTSLQHAAWLRAGVCYAALETRTCVRFICQHLYNTGRTMTRAQRQHLVKWLTSSRYRRARNDTI